MTTVADCYILFIVKEKRNDMHIILNHSSMVPIYEQLMEQIKSEIINTALKEGEALPSAVLWPGNCGSVR